MFLGQKIDEYFPKVEIQLYYRICKQCNNLISVDGLKSFILGKYLISPSCGRWNEILDVIYNHIFMKSL